ncbi:prepilin-type N-terminal cleavage/methylation domain-containing protein [bacterium]|nr:prepilin-type N-terminal cleavage/methylation domain-containing protein [bacterium]
MMKSTRQIFSSGKRAAFTLLEVMLAVMIFAICMMALYNSFNISAHAFEKGRSAAEITQKVRFVIDRLTRDLHGVFYETGYNRKFELLERTILANPQPIIDAQEHRKAVQLPGLIQQREDDDTDPTSPFVGLHANLRLKGSSHSIEFARHVPSDGTFDNSYLGAERVHYFLSNNRLFRKRARIFQPMHLNPNLWQDLVQAQEINEAARKNSEKGGQPFLDYMQVYGLGELPAQFRPPFEIEYFVAKEVVETDPELIARNVLEFEIKYGYYAANGWQEVDSWDSMSKERRTPAFNLQPDDPQFTQKLSIYQRRQPDSLPSYIALRMKVAEDIREKRGEARSSGLVRTAETRIWIPTSIEGFVPDDLMYFEPTPLEEER